MIRREFSIRLLASAAVLLVSSCGGDKTPRNGHHSAPPPPPSQSAAVPLSPPPPVVAQSAIVVDNATGRVLFAKNADLARPVASTQKIITALVVLDAGNLDKPVTIQASDEAVQPSKLYMKPGQVYTRRTLLTATMIKSGNDIARALARDVGGSRENFAMMMNRKARSLGMRRSHFTNPHGLPDPAQHSTARDIAIAARKAYRSPTIRSYTRIQKYTFRYSNGRTRTIENTNKLLKRVPYCDGMKTGTTNKAGRCLVSTGTLNGRSVVVVVLKSTSRSVWNDSEKLLRWALESPTRSSGAVPPTTFASL